MRPLLFDAVPSPRIVHSRPAIAWLRIATGIAWLATTLLGRNAELAPRFLDGTLLAHRIDGAALAVAGPGLGRAVHAVVSAHAPAVALGIAAVDILIGISLVFGLFTRLGGALAILRAAVNIAVLGAAGTDALGFNVLLIVVSVTLITTCAGRQWGLDGPLYDRAGPSPSLSLVA